MSKERLVSARDWRRAEKVEEVRCEPWRCALRLDGALYCARCGGRLYEARREYDTDPDFECRVCGRGWRRKR